MKKSRINGNNTDEELLELFNKTNDPEHFGILYSKYIPLVYGVCLKYLGRKDKAQDAVMDIYEMLTIRISFYEIKTFKPWLHTVTKNHCLQKIREKQNKFSLEFSPEFVESDVVLDLFNKSYDKYNFNIDENKDVETLLNECIDRLPEGQKMSISSFFFEEMSYADIVEKAEIELKTVKSNIQNGKRNLKICLEKNIIKDDEDI